MKVRESQAPPRSRCAALLHDWPLSPGDLNTHLKICGVESLGLGVQTGGLVAEARHDVLDLLCTALFDLLGNSISRIASAVVIIIVVAVYHCCISLSYLYYCYTLTIRVILQ